MADDDNDEEKTEDPTPRKMEQALEQGQVINSREVTSFLMILALSLVVAWLIPASLKELGFFLRSLLDNVADIDLSEDNLSVLMHHIIYKSLSYIILLLVFLVIAAIFASFIQQGQFNISSEPLMPKLSKISPMAGFKRLFSVKSLMEFLKGLLKILIVGYIVYITIFMDIKELKLYQTYTLIALLYKIYEIVIDILIDVCIVVAIIAAMDYLYQRYEHFKSMRMTKKEIKDEHKQSEGNPEIKQKMRSIRLERSRNRMMSKVPDADVVITNPTHYSIALQYDEKTMSAPLVVAMGKDNVALKIREIAEENEIPMVENPPLARALYASAELDKQIPFEHFEAVAEVISYIYNLRSQR